MRAWSSRTHDIDTAVTDQGVISPGVRDVLQKQTRQAKSHVDRETLRAQWQAQALELGWQPEPRHTRPVTIPTIPPPIDRDALYAALTEHNATFDLRDLYIALGTQSYGHRDLAGIQQAVDAALTDPEVVRIPGIAPDHFTTQSMLELERATLDRVAALAARPTHPTPPMREDIALSTEQADAVRKLLNQPGHLHILTGPAGSGKSHTLDAARASWQTAGYHVVGAAVAAKAAAVLEEAAHMPSHTVAHLLHQGLPAHTPTVLVVDEASMLDTREVAALVDLVESRDAQLVLVGDPDQLPAIGPGGMFRATLQLVEPARLTTMQRQADIGARQATRSFAQRDAAAALAWFEAAGLVHVAPAADLMPALVEAWLADQGYGSQLMVASTRQQVFHLNRLARQGLQQLGQLAPDQYVIPTAFGDRAISIGDRLVLRQNEYRAYDVRNGDRATISDLRITRDGHPALTLTLDNGRTLIVDPARYPHWDWAYATTIHQAQGQTVDRVHWLVSLTDEATHAYVATSRARTRTDLYINDAEWTALDRLATQDQTLQRVAHRLARPGQKHLALDELTPMTH
jgi:ATP-dependent exoDNAse (exonuclease V) alpha subunit